MKVWVKDGAIGGVDHTPREIESFLESLFDIK